MSLIAACGLPRVTWCGEPDAIRSAFATVLTLGIGPAKIGLVFRGPAPLSPDIALPRSVYSELLDWARDQGYMFLRFTHSDPEILTGLGYRW